MVLNLRSQSQILGTRNATGGGSLTLSSTLPLGFGMFPASDPFRYIYNTTVGMYRGFGGGGGISTRKQKAGGRAVGARAVEWEAAKISFF
jgi:hypothetical protein